MTDPPLISIVVAAVSKFKGARVINWLQDVFPEVATQLKLGSSLRFAGALLGRLRNWSLRAAHANVVLGARMQAILEQIDVSPARICVIENWAIVDDTPPVAPLQSRLRGRLNLHAKFVVGYSGNLGRGHDMQTVLDAAALLSADDDIVFLMIGGGTGMTALKRSAESRGLRNFHFLPYQSRAELPDCMAAADLHWVSLLPPLEGLIVPSKIYGILAAGRPMIFVGDRDGEVSRVIGPARAGVAVAIGDCGGFARQIACFKADPMLRREMGNNGYELFRNKFTLQRALTRWMNTLVLQTPRRNAERTVEM